MVKQAATAVLNTAPVDPGLGATPSAGTIKRYGPYQTNSGHWFWCDYDQASRTQKSVLVHREVMEKHLGRKLGPKEVVHHRDENPSNNEIENLEVKEWGQHSRDHHGPVEWIALICLRCGDGFIRRAHSERGNRKQLKGGPYCGKSCAAKATYVLHAGHGVPIHGTRNAYKYHRCRCADCRGANAKHQRDRRLRA